MSDYSPEPFSIFQDVEILKGSSSSSSERFRKEVGSFNLANARLSRVFSTSTFLNSLSLQSLLSMSIPSTNYGFQGPRYMALGWPGSVQISVAEVLINILQPF